MSHFGKKHGNQEQQVEVLQVELKTLQSKVLEQESTILSLRSEVSQKNDQLSFLTDEKIVGEEALEASQQECSQLTSLIKELDDNITQLTSTLATRTRERDNAISAEKREIEVRLINEGEFQKKYTNLESMLQSAQAEQKKYENRLENCKQEQQLSEQKLERAGAEMKAKQMQLEDAEKDIEQLRNLVTQLDSTREELVDKLQCTLSEHQQAVNQLTTVESELRRFNQETELRNAEVLQLHALIETLGGERDHLETELHINAETYQEIKEENKRAVAEAAQMNKELQKAERAVQAQALQLQQVESKLSSLREEFSMEESSRKTFEDRCAAKAAELQSLTEDITRMTCEQQLARSELRQMALDREGFLEELRDMETKLAFSEQVIYSKEKEEKELVLSYQNLCDDYQKLKLSTIEMETQIRQQKFQIQSTEEVLYASQERAKSLDEELQKFIMEAKALERENEKLARSLAQQSAISEDYQKEKCALSAQVTTIRQVALEMEQKYENISRDLGSLEAQNRILTDVLQERAQEIEALASRYRLEQEHVREVEKLLSCLRAQEHQWELESKDTETRNALMRERLSSFEEQIKMLQATRDAQNKEIMRLQALMQNKAADSEMSRRSFSFTSETHGIEALKDLEEKNSILSADLCKACELYKDCLARLERTEAQCSDQKREYDQILDLLAKVDEERTQLQKRCGELLAKHSPISGSPLTGSPRSDHNVWHIRVRSRSQERIQRDDQRSCSSLSAD